MFRSLPLFSVFLLLLPVIASAELGDGCTIAIIQPQSAADKAGARLGDILLEADGKSIGTMSDLHIAVTPVEGEFVMKVQRADKIVKLKADVHTTPGMPKLGVRCVPLKDDASVSAVDAPKVVAQEQEGEDLPKLVPAAAPSASIQTLAPLAGASAVSSPAPSATKPEVAAADAEQDSVLPDSAGTLLDCPFPMPAHAKAKLTLKDGHTVEGKLISCEPQKVSIRSGLLSGTFLSSRVLKIEILP